MTITARPTTYKGIRMRSRLEASFAQILDRENATWEYEPGCFADETGQYLPDFKWHLDDETLYVEVKPTIDHVPAAMQAMERILSSEPSASLAVVLPIGDWPNIGFEVVAERRKAGLWTGSAVPPAPPTTSPGDVARAQLNSSRLRNVSVGDVVGHAKWGEGIVLHMAGTGNQAEATINFATVGEKTLLIAWAPLTRIAS